MFWVEDFLDAPPLKVRMAAQNVHEVAPGNSKQYRGPIHVNRDLAVGPGGHCYHLFPLLCSAGLFKFTLGVDLCGFPEANSAGE